MREAHQVRPQCWLDRLSPPQCIVLLGERRLFFVLLPQSPGSCCHETVQQPRQYHPSSRQDSRRHIPLPSVTLDRPSHAVLSQGSSWMNSILYHVTASHSLKILYAMHPG